jgi:hypothetical protein
MCDCYRIELKSKGFDIVTRDFLPSPQNCKNYVGNTTSASFDLEMPK